MASNHEHHDKLDKAGLAAWFNSIEIEFENVQEQESDAANKLTFRKNRNIAEHVSDKELDLIPYYYILLNALGYKFDRMREIISGVQPSELESGLIQWSFKIVRLVNKAVHTKSPGKAEDILDEAYHLLLEKMNKPEAKKNTAESPWSFTE